MNWRIIRAVQTRGGKQVLRQKRKVIHLPVKHERSQPKNFDFLHQDCIFRPTKTVKVWCRTEILDGLRDHPTFLGGEGAGWAWVRHWARALDTKILFTSGEVYRLYGNNSRGSIALQVLKACFCAIFFPVSFYNGNSKARVRRDDNTAASSFTRYTRTVVRDKRSYRCFASQSSL